MFSSMTINKLLLTVERSNELVRLFFNTVFLDQKSEVRAPT